MTALLDAAPTTAVSQPPMRRMTLQRILMVIALVAVPTATALIVLSYHHAAAQPTPDDLQFALYWSGFLTGMLSLVLLACASNTDAVMRMCALAGIGLFGMVPRFQKGGPSGSDEYIHLRQAMEAFFDGDVGQTLFLLPITKEFFGLHQVSSAFARLSGMPLWFAGLTVLVLAHILSVLAVYQLIRLLDVPARGAAVGAVVYTLNPSWLFFNAGFSYESLALPLLLWCLAATVGAGRGTTRPSYRSIGAAMFCAFALPTMHHLSTIVLFCILTLLVVARLALWYPRTLTDGLGTCPERLWPLAVIWFALVGSIHLWWSENYSWLVAYLSPAWTEGLSQLGRIVDGVGNKAGGQRSLFGDALNPLYEVLAGYLYPFLALGIFCWSLTVVWRHRGQVGTAVWAFAVVGSMFFASMPLVLTQGGAEGAHRSWGYSFIGIAVLAGLAWSYGPRMPASSARWPSWLTRTGSVIRFGAVSRRVGHRGVRTAVACVVFLVMSIGSSSLGVNLSNRFPGSANVGDDARSFSNEGLAVTEWIARHAVVDTPVLADRWVSLQVGSFGRMSALRPSETFPVWDLYMSADPVRPEVLKQVWDSDIRYFVVDSRMATTRPKIGYWFTRSEPGARGDELFPQSALNRFNCLPWLRGVFAAGPLTVYEVNRDMLVSSGAGSCEESPV